MKYLSIILTSLALSIVSLGITGCNTVEGFGKDVKKTGSAIEESAKENK